MMEFLIIRDTVTGGRLCISGLSPEQRGFRDKKAPIKYTASVDDTDPIPIKKASIRKTIKTWMKEVKKNDNCR